MYAQDDAPDAAPAHKAAGKKKAGKKKGKAGKAEKAERPAKEDKAEKPGKGDASPHGQGAQESELRHLQEAGFQGHALHLPDIRELVRSLQCGDAARGGAVQGDEQVRGGAHPGERGQRQLPGHGLHEKVRCELPCAMGNSERHKLLGWEDRNGIPYAIIVDADGNKLTSGNAASVIGGWKQTTGKQ